MLLETLIVADGVSTPPDGKFYVHGGGISRLEVPKLPFPIPLGILLRLRVEDDDDYARTHQVGIVLIGPRGLPNVPGVEFELAAPDDAQEPLESEERVANVALTINAVAVHGGVYTLKVDLDGETVRELPLPLIVTDGARSMLVPQEWPAN